MEYKRKTREEKIKLLNDLKTGKVKVQEVFPKLPEHWVYEKSRSIYSRGDQELNEDEFKALKKRKGKDWLFYIWELNDMIGAEGEPIETVSNCKDFEWPKSGQRPLDDKQVKKIIAVLRQSSICKKLQKSATFI